MNKKNTLVFLSLFSVMLVTKAQDIVWDFAADAQGWHDLGAGRDVKAGWDNGSLKMTYIDGAPTQGPQLWFAAVQVEKEFDASTHRYLEISYTPLNWPTTAPVKFLISLLNSAGEPVYSYAELDPQKNFVSVDVAAFDPGWGKKYTSTMKQLQLELPHNGDPASNPASAWFGASTLIHKIELTNTQTIPPSPDKVLLWSFDKDFSDSTGTISGIAGGNPVIDATAAKKGSGALVFGGTDSLTLPANLIFSSEKITYTFWIKTPAAGQADPGIPSRIISYGNGNFELVLYNGNLCLSNYRLWTVLAMPWKNNVWQHVALVLDGSNVSCYINGIKSVDTFTAPALDRSGNLVIGGNGLTAIIDELSIYNYVNNANLAQGTFWQSPQGQVMTRWAKDVMPDNVLPEYPRPQMTRTEWMNLNGPWEMDIWGMDKAVTFNETLPGTILVPFPIESALSGVQKKSDHIIYRKTFNVPELWNGKSVLLHFGAVDWETTAYLNGIEIGNHKGGYDPFSYDITNALHETGPQELIVKVFDPTNSGAQACGKQVNMPKDLFYTSTTGIWQTVWLEPVNINYIHDIKLTPDIDNSTINIISDGISAGTGLKIKAEIFDGGNLIAQQEAEAGQALAILIPGQKLWSPANPFLYEVTLTLTDNGKTVDSVRSYFGMRKISIGKDEKGITRILLNNKFEFLNGPLDQGFWPDGIYTAPTDEALKNDILVMKDLGFNMVRKHIKVEPQRWYYWCDKLGLIVMQDMPAAHPIDYDKRRSTESDIQFKSELEKMVKTHWNHPSIVMWVVFNEGWGQQNTESLTSFVKGLDPSRLVSNASGGVDKNAGDIIDIHSYPGPDSPNPEASRAAVLGEFGAYWLPLTGTQPDAGILSNYKKLYDKIWLLKDSPGLSAAVYTQITDVEGELNGLLSYDRNVFKIDSAKAYHINRNELPVDTIPAAPVWGFEKDTEGWHDFGAGRDVKATWDNGSLKMAYYDGTPDPAQGPQLYFPAIQVEQEFNADDYPYLELFYTSLNWPVTAPVKFVVALSNSNNEIVFALAELDPKKNFVSVDIAASDPGWGKKYSGMMKSVNIELPWGGDASANPAANWFASSTLLDKVAFTKIKTTGVKDISNESGSIYPNPASKSFNVSGVDTDKISIYNSLGLLVKKVSKTNKNISVDGFAKGLYFVKIEYLGVTAMKKLIVE